MLSKIQRQRDRRPILKAQAAHGSHASNLAGGASKVTKKRLPMACCRFSSQWFNRLLLLGQESVLIQLQVTFLVISALGQKNSLLLQDPPKLEHSMVHHACDGRVEALW